MSIEITMLVWSAALAWLQILPYAAGRNGAWTSAQLFGNRDDPPTDTGWVGRALRAHKNMLESLPIFAALVLAAQVTNHTNHLTAVGAELFFWARLAYAVIYIAGIPYVRTAAWFAGVVGMALIFFQVV
jgi:uncharacterized MAPEG superfamily protein